VANYIKERTKNAQFIVISLRNNMFELAARLVGVYKVNHMTKSVTIDNKDYIVGRRKPQQQHDQKDQKDPRYYNQQTTMLGIGFGSQTPAHPQSYHHHVMATPGLLGTQRTFLNPSQGGQPQGSQQVRGSFSSSGSHSASGSGPGVGGSVSLAHRPR
jgi:hypothetical protein